MVDVSFKQIHTITMKHLFLILFASIVCFSVQGQNENEESPLAGRRIVSGSFNGNFRDQDNFNQSNINANILIGKIKDNNTYIAFGGNWGGRKGIDPTNLPQQMEIDYVRVYQKKPE